ncbi:MAG: hypothetical protein OEZ39_12735 [Gammaproteobacteria bacterium]|nr:hypothetical protein [Gammaproteobacteria bacterium]MDH5652713.1 hypothetical protein [Gammaproteobacteria bacterium]
MKISLFLFCLLCPLLLYAAVDEDDYQKIDYTQIRHIHGALLKKSTAGTGHNLAATTHKYRLTVKFSRDIRKLSPANRKVLQDWGETLRVREDFLAQYQREFKVALNGETLWIPLREPMVNDMGNELHTDNAFELFVLLIGAIDQRFVFLATDFKSSRSLEQ